MDILLFPFHDYWWFYGLFTLFVLFLLALDLGVFHRNVHEVSWREAATWSLVWFVLALLFNYALYQYALWEFSSPDRLAELGASPQAIARQVSLEFLTGYLIEKSLAVDNIFVFVVIFKFFGIPGIYQHRILFYGVLGALLFRAIFIGLGAVLLQYEIVTIIFGLFLIVTGIKLFFAPEKEADLESNWVLRLLKKSLPVTSQLHGKKFWTVQDGRRVATPLFIALIIVEASDIIFAVDSVPAIFAITDEPLIVFTSNIFAILGLRSLYFLLAGSMHRFHLIKYGLGAVLVFVGLKMVWLNEMFDGKFPISWSLGFIAVVMVGSIILSLLITPKVNSADEVE